MQKIVLLFFCLAGAFTLSAFPKAVCFRYDDNQSAEIYSALADVFRRNGVRFSMSLNPLQPQAKNPVWCKTICTLADEGFEVMNHTPGHNSLSIQLSPGDPLMKTAAADPGTDHISANTIRLKADPGKSTYSKEFTVSIRNKNRISGNPQLKARLLLRIRGKFYYTFKNPQKGDLYLCSLWGENNVVLPDEDNVPVQICSSRFTPAPGSYELMMKIAHEGFRRIGLKKMPRVWIQPGGYYPLMEAAALRNVLGKHGYVSATGLPRSFKGFNAPDMENSCFAMDWGDFNLGKFDVKRAKRNIAAAVACHRIAICSSHVEPARRGKLAQYTSAIEQVIKWTKAKEIRILRQSEAALLLKTATADPKKNIFPSLNCDLDEDGIPDGFISKNASFKNGTAYLKGKSRLSVRYLCGLPRGKARLSLEHTGLAKSKILIQYCGFDKKTFGKQEFSISAGTTVCELTIPEKCAALNFELIKRDNGEARINSISLTGR